MNTPSQAALELPPGKLYHDKEEFGDWGWIRAEGSPALVAVVKWPGPTEEECERHRSAGTDPHQPMVNRIIQCYNACAGITDPAAHITGLENQLEAWETSAKLRDDGLCPTQREVIADQQAQIERLEALRDELVFAAKQAHTCLDLWRDNCVQGGEHDSAWVTLMNKLAQVIAKANNTPWFPTVAKDEGGAA